MHVIVYAGGKSYETKDHYNDEYIKDFSEKIFFVLPGFDRKAFSHDLIGQLDNKELFARFDCIVDTMKMYMDGNYSKNIQAFLTCLDRNWSSQKECLTLDGGCGPLAGMLNGMGMKIGIYHYLF